MALYRYVSGRLQRLHYHYDDVRMGLMASQITSLTIVYSTVYSGADQSKHQSSASLAIVWGIHRGPVNSPHTGPVTRKMFPFDDVIMTDTKIFQEKIHPCPNVNRRLAKPLLTLAHGWLIVAHTWWRHQMEKFSALLALCAGNSPVTKKASDAEFDVFFDLRLNKWLSKQSWGWWFETLSCSSWCHCNDIYVGLIIYPRSTFNAGV